MTVLKLLQFAVVTFINQLDANQMCPSYSMSHMCLDKLTLCFPTVMSNHVSVQVASLTAHIFGISSSKYNLNIVCCTYLIIAFRDKSLSSQHQALNGDIDLSGEGDQVWHGNAISFSSFIEYYQLGYLKQRISRLHYRYFDLHRN